MTSTLRSPRATWNRTTSSRPRREGAVDGQSTVNGDLWERQVSPDGRTRSLVQRTDTVTTVVAGDTSYGALEAFAATLASS